jgi:hypothetical protein
MTTTETAALIQSKMTDSEDYFRMDYRTRSAKTAFNILKCHVGAYAEALRSGACTRSYEPPTLIRYAGELVRYLGLDGEVTPREVVDCVLADC